MSNLKNYTRYTPNIFKLKDCYLRQQSHVLIRQRITQNSHVRYLSVTRRCKSQKISTCHGIWNAQQTKSQRLFAAGQSTKNIQITQFSATSVSDKHSLFLVQVQNPFGQLYKWISAEKTDLSLFVYRICVRQRRSFSGMHRQHSPIVPGGFQATRERFYRDLTHIPLGFCVFLVCYSLGSLRFYKQFEVMYCVLMFSGRLLPASSMSGFTSTRNTHLDTKSDIISGHLTLLRPCYAINKILFI